ncbi:hypothetical protein Clacol_010621 [Clathrus columnatus]|uniref:Nucleosome assembly protein 1-like 1 n=1 Tax=Clathrus columnatus TaxID=1419009 RepID=A0AAV5AS03_9AGAM|nr:hypothetical protein Clacol_010621 [Clathrus columnatus]
MSTNVNIPSSQSSITAPTPQNTPLTAAPINQQLSRPTVPDIQENEDEDDEDDDDELSLPRAGNNNVGQAGVSGLGPEQHAILTQLVQGKLSGLIGKSSGYIESLPVEVKRNIEALIGVQSDYIKLQKEHKKEVLELEKKYMALFTPLFDRRVAIISGISAPTEDEIKAGEEQSAKDDPDYTPLPSLSATAISPSLSAANPGMGIPEFWLTALRNHIGISELVTDRDAEALKQLTDIRVSYPSGEQLGFRIHFYFAPNDYFTDKELTKTYIYKDDLGYEGDFVYERAEGCKIHWKEDKDLTKSFEIKKQRNKNTNRTRLIRKVMNVDSFFNFFSPPVPPSEEDIENGNVDDEVLEDLEDRLELDYQIGEDLKERVVPKAVDYFTGKALEYEDMDLGSDEGDDQEFDDDDEEDDDDDDDDDVEDIPVRKRNLPPPRRGGKSQGGAGNNKEDCKQQ